VTRRSSAFSRSGPLPYPTIATAQVNGPHRIPVIPRRTARSEANV